MKKDLSYGPRYHRVYAVFPPVRAGRLLPGDSRALRRHLPSIVSCIPPVATWMIAVADKPAQEKSCAGSSTGLIKPGCQDKFSPVKRFAPAPSLQARSGVRMAATGCGSGPFRQWAAMSGLCKGPLIAINRRHPRRQARYFRAERCTLSCALFSIFCPAKAPYSLANRTPARRCMMFSMTGAGSGSIFG